MTKTLIISDIHLGARNSQTASLAAFLDQDFDRLILNGDTVDSLNFRRFQPRHWSILDQIRRIARERELILIRGNHDGCPAARPQDFGPLSVLAQLLAVDLYEEYELGIGRRRYLVLHGDRFDRTLNLTWVGHTADTFYNGVQSCSKPLARWLKGRVKHWCGVVTSVSRGAVAYAQQHSCQGVITGHTHYHADEWMDGIHYLNTGCWVEHPGTYLLVQDGHLQLREWCGNPSVVKTGVSEPAGKHRSPVEAAVPYPLIMPEPGLMPLTEAAPC